MMKLLLAAVLLSANLFAEDIPFLGNAFATKGSAPKGDRGFKLEAPDSVVSLFFHVDRAADLKLSLKASVPAGDAVVRAKIDGQTFDAALSGSAGAALGQIQVKSAGYVRVDFVGTSKAAELEALAVESVTPDLVLSYVKNNEGNFFYWGRRGPSVHLGYELPRDRQSEWFYNEVTVPQGNDPVGSYFMANGFSEGYFGMQVNSDTERKILFSVWSPFHTDDPKSIPEDQRIKVLAKGEGVKIGEFGNEGSGGQSFFTYPWKAGETYRFLNRATPNGKGATIYSAWFYTPERKRWQLIAIFQRPQTDKYLTGVHSFLENFIDTKGWLTREAHYGNAWVRDVSGQWNALHHARFTGDDTARRRFRLDFAGGVIDGSFFLRNGGFFSTSTPLGSTFETPSDAVNPPDIDLEKLDGFATSGLPK